MLSWIQKEALMVLLRADSASVKEMKPADMAANAFAYHLDGLQADGYVTKVARGRYSLTPKGERLVGAFSTSTNRASEYIKTVIFLYAEQGGRYLFFTWSRQPYFGRTSLVQDHVARGKSLARGLADAVNDKLGVDVTPTFMTSALIKVEHAGELVSHMNALVYRVDADALALPFTSRNGTAFMAWPDDVPGLMDGMKELLAGLTTVHEPMEYLLTY